MLSSTVVGPRNLEEITQRFRRDGFVNAGPIITAAEARQLGAELEQRIARLFAKRPSKDRIHADPPLLGLDASEDPEVSLYQATSLWKASKAFERAVFNDALAEIAAGLLESNVVQLWVDKALYKPSYRGAHFAWHQDGSYHTSLEPAESILTAWIALEDTDVASGCMWMVPGSHRWGHRPQHFRALKSIATPAEFEALPCPAEKDLQRDWQGAVPCPVGAGEVHFHHALTWHASPMNRSSRPRPAYSMHLMPEGVRVRQKDQRIPLPVGSPMIEAGAEFPVLYRSRRASAFLPPDDSPSSTESGDA